MNRRMDEHARMCARMDGKTNMQGYIFTNRQTFNHAKVQEKEQHAHTTSTEPNDHQGLHTPCHAKLKL